MPKHNHPEAFCLMTYQADDGSETETIWNSRDGVTPFGLTLRSGKPARHINWQGDVYAPNHVPKPGDRIFVDLTEERARQNALRMVNLHPQYIPAGETAEKMVDLVVANHQPGAPDLIEVS